MTGMVSIRLKLDAFHKLADRDAVEAGQVGVVDINGRKVNFATLPEKVRGGLREVGGGRFAAFIIRRE